MGELGLTLSGGGFRATLFHFGVIRFLRDIGLLGDIKHISAVSGGSILAAHLVLNWERYTASHEEYAKISDEIIRFCRQDIRGRIVRRCLVRRRTLLLQRYLSTLYDNADLHSLQGSYKHQRPDLYILATSMTTGDYCWFSKNGFSVDQGDKVKHFPGTLLPLSLAVAASVAFPPLFPPVVLRREHVNASVSDFPFSCEYLSDGGIFDNIGVRHFSQLEKRNTLSVERLICSDGSATMDWNPNSRFAFVYSRTVRATDIMMKRVADLEDERIKLKGNILRISIDNEVAAEDFPSALRPDLQRKVAKIRTDLDLFSDVEIWALIQHGYEVAYKMFKKSDPMPDICGTKMPQVDGTWNPCPGINKVCDAQRGTLLHEAATRKRRLWSYKDRASWLLLIILLLVISVITFPWWPYVTRSFDERLASYVRVKASRNLKPLPPEITSDVQQNLSLIGWTRKTEPLDLSLLSINGVQLPQAHLEHVILWGSDLESANLRGAQLIDADLGGTNFNNADLTGADLSRAYIWESNIEPPKRWSSLRKAILRGAILKKTILTKAHLEGADLEKAELRSAYLLGADLTGAHMIGTILVGANLSGAILKDADLRDADLTSANLSGADFLNAKHLEQKQISTAMYNEHPPKNLPPGISPPPKMTFNH